MRRTILTFLIIILLITIGIVMMVYSKQSKKQPEPKKLVAKFSFGKQGKGLGEFGGSGGYLTAFIVKGNYLYVADTGNSRIQVLEIK